MSIQLTQADAAGNIGTSACVPIATRNAVWVNKGTGNDANSGLTPALPKATNIGLVTNPDFPAPPKIEKALAASERVYSLARGPIVLGASTDEEDLTKRPEGAAMNGSCRRRNAPRSSRRWRIT